MSTNFYATLPSGKDLHIGKRSIGWDFLWRGHENQNLFDRRGWERLLRITGVVIVDEYGIRYTFHEFINEVNKLKDNPKKHVIEWMKYGRDESMNIWLRHNWLDSEGNPFSGQEFC